MTKFNLDLDWKSVRGQRRQQRHAAVLKPQGAFRSQRSRPWSGGAVARVNTHAPGGPLPHWLPGRSIRHPVTATPLGPPAYFPPTLEGLTGKTDFVDDREMLLHVMRLLLETETRLHGALEVARSLPESSPSPLAPRPMPGPRYAETSTGFTLTGTGRSQQPFGRPLLHGACRCNSGAILRA